MADDTCTCQQCRVTRALFGDTVPTTEQRSEAVWTLVFVMASQLARFRDEDMLQALAAISQNRIELMERWERQRSAQGDSGCDLANAEVAGHG